MGWWRKAMWSDVRVAMMMMAEQRAADREALADGDTDPSPNAATSGTFGKPPPADVLALVPRESR